MPNLFSSLTSKIFGASSIALLLALGVLWASDSLKINALKRDLATANGTIASQRVDLATLRGNQAGLIAGVNACNTSVDSYKDVVEKLAAAGTAALNEVKKGNTALNHRLGVIDKMPAASCEDALGILKAGGN